MESSSKPVLPVYSPSTTAQTAASSSSHLAGHDISVVVRPPSGLHRSIVHVPGTFEPAVHPSFDHRASVISGTPAASSGKEKRKRKRKATPEVSPPAAKRRRGEGPPRPRNNFFIFLVDCREGKVSEVREELELDAHDPSSFSHKGKNVCKAAGKHWRTLAPEEQAKYPDRARHEKAEHARMHPDYRYRPRPYKRKTRNKDIGKSNAASEVRVDARPLYSASREPTTSSQSLLKESPRPTSTRAATSQTSDNFTLPSHSPFATGSIDHLGATTPAFNPLWLDASIGQSNIDSPWAGGGADALLTQDMHAPISIGVRHFNDQPAQTTSESSAAACYGSDPSNWQTAAGSWASLALLAESSCASNDVTLPEPTNLVPRSDLMHTSHSLIAEPFDTRSGLPLQPWDTEATSLGLDIWPPDSAPQAYHMPQFGWVESNDSQVRMPTPIPELGVFHQPTMPHSGSDGVF